ncbi:MAG: efflux RND transporter permease subunit [Myxococcaceae bacterium]
MTSPSRLERIFRRVIALRLPILVLYGLLLPAAAYLSTRIPSEGAIDRLIIPSDPDYLATQSFHQVFVEGQTVLVLLEAEDPWQPAVLQEAASLEARLGAVPGVTVFSALSVYRRAHPEFTPDERGAEALRRFASGAKLFRKQGLTGEHFLGLATAFTPKDREGRDAILEGIDAAAAATGGPVRKVRKVGAPYVVSWIERETGRASVRYFPFFALFVVAIALFLYRSVRSLLAILISLAASVALTVGAGYLLGFSFTVVSAVVPLTVMVTVLATLVYLHSRFVDQPEGVPLETHHLQALSNKFLPVTASTVAAVLGFAALSVSRIRPIREMGIWTALGLSLSWVVAFTLFPALQRVLRTPTGQVVPIRSAFYDRVASAIPSFTHRFRWPLVAGAVGLALAGVVALFGVPGRLAPMKVGIDQLEYVDPDLDIYRDMVFFRDHVAGLNVVRVWVKTPPGAVTDPLVLRGLDRFTTAVQEIPGVSSALGPTTFLRMRRYLAGEGDTLPEDPEAFAGLAGDLEQLLLTEPELRGFIDVGTLSNAQVTVIFERGEEAGYLALAAALREAWDRTVAADPALGGLGMQVVGESLLQAKVATSLVPTLTESFAITAALIFAAFLFVFRSPSARLMAMIPSFFAILVTFLGMRLLGGSLNVATILIATTVLGTTENDQIHFFHHLGEGEGPGGLDAALRHTLRVAGRAIVFATLINAAGFLALAFSNFPPLRQFGVVTSAAFLLAMLADFTALPASLWLVRRQRPR